MRRTSNSLVRSLLFVISSLVILCDSATYGQWSHDPNVNNPICIAPYIQYDPEIVSDQIGGAIISWWDLRNLDSSIYCQRINALGVIEWVPNGVQIVASGSSIGHRMLSDGNGGAILIWSDSRYDPDIFAIFAQRIDGHGVVQWTANGVPIADAGGLADAISDEAGGAFLVYYKIFEGFTAIYAQHINPNGATTWNSNGVPICTTPVDLKKGAEIVIDGNGGAIITWYERRIPVRGFDIYAQRVNESGVVQWTTNGVSICNVVGEQIYPSLVSDQAGGAVIAWNDGRDTAGVYCQRIGGSGVVQWSLNGMYVGPQYSQTYTPPILGDGNGGAFIGTWVMPWGGGVQHVTTLVINVNYNSRSTTIIFPGC